MQVEFSRAMTVTFMLGLLLSFVGNVLQGVPTWRSGTQPRWVRAIWAASALMLYPLGAVLGQATTGSSLPTQPVAALLAVIGGGWIAWSVMREPSAQVGVEAHPRVQRARRATFRERLQKTGFPRRLLLSAIERTLYSLEPTGFVHTRSFSGMLVPEGSVLTSKCLTRKRERGV